jgi:hypothetical protein
VAHKNPADRPHVWHRDPRVDEVVTPDAEQSTYPHQVPRYLHKGGHTLLVETAEACDKALASGWALVPKHHA